MSTGEIKRKLYDITGYHLKGDSYVLQAFTRSSYSGYENNEIFEMYGDSILSSCVMQLVHEHFGLFRSENNVNYKSDTGYALKGITNEAQLDLIKKKLVSNETLAAQVDKWDIARYLKMGKSDIQNNVAGQTKTKADLFEAIIGAYAVTYNFDSNIMMTIVKRMLPVEEIFREIEDEHKPQIDFSIDNSITVLKELSEKGILSSPSYTSYGPDDLGRFDDGSPRWACQLTVQSIGFIESVFSNSSKTAKRLASYMALCKYFEKTTDFTRKNLNNKHVVQKDGDYIIVPDKE